MPASGASRIRQKTGAFRQFHAQEIAEARGRPRTNLTHAQRTEFLEFVDRQCARVGIARIALASDGDVSQSLFREAPPYVVQHHQVDYEEGERAKKRWLIAYRRKSTSLFKEYLSGVRQSLPFSTARTILSRLLTQIVPQHLTYDEWLSEIDACSVTSDLMWTPSNVWLETTKEVQNKLVSRQWFVECDPEIAMALPEVSVGMLVAAHLHFLSEQKFITDEAATAALKPLVNFSQKIAETGFVKLVEIIGAAVDKKDGSGTDRVRTFDLLVERARRHSVDDENDPRSSSPNQPMTAFLYLLKQYLDSTQQPK